MTTRKEGWTRLLVKFNKIAKTTYFKTQVQGRLSFLKAEYTRVRQLRNNSGFGWDEAKQLPTVPDEVWMAFLAAHPKSSIYRLAYTCCVCDN
ncbi:hypothetical protein AC1031_020636 [Aphanomyces cochlioides]|nr:hypothetical protein AC1031_020636 [Aphanomyces cochlioides]